MVDEAVPRIPAARRRDYELHLHLLRWSPPLSRKTGTDAPDFRRILDHRDDGHLPSALRAEERVHLVDLRQEASPRLLSRSGPDLDSVVCHRRVCLGRGRFGDGDLRAPVPALWRPGLQGWPFLPCPPSPGRVHSVSPDQMFPFGRNMEGDLGDEPKAVEVPDLAFPVPLLRIGIHCVRYREREFQRIRVQPFGLNRPPSMKSYLPSDPT